MLVLPVDTFDETSSDLVGFLAGIAQPLAETRVPIMVYSTYRRDIVLTPSKDLEKAIKTLTTRGYAYREILPNLQL